MPTDADYSIADLARLTGLSVRTIRYYLSQGLIPASGESGPGAHYGQGHLDRLRLIKRLQAEYLPNAEIRRRLAPLSDADVASVVSEGAEVAVERPTTSALDYVRRVLGEPAPGAPPAPGMAPPPGLRPVPAMPAMRDMPPARAASPALAAKAGRMLRRAVGESMPVAAYESEPKDPPSPAEAPTPERSQWERLQLGDNIELHIRRPLSRPEQRRVERLITIARQVLDERNAP
jgi:DNA-binding transcriptional MerR regulator